MRACIHFLCNVYHSRTCCWTKTINNRIYSVIKQSVWFLWTILTGNVGLISRILKEKSLKWTRKPRDLFIWSSVRSFQGETNPFLSPDSGCLWIRRLSSSGVIRIRSLSWSTNIQWDSVIQAGTGQKSQCRTPYTYSHTHSHLAVN